MSSNDVATPTLSTATVAPDYAVPDPKEAWERFILLTDHVLSVPKNCVEPAIKGKKSSVRLNRQRLSMAEINTIPDRVLPAYATIAKLGTVELAELIQVLELANPTMWPTQLSSEIASQIKNIEPSQAQSIVNALVSLYVVRTEFNLSIEEAVEQVLSASRENGEPAFNEEEKQLLKPILPRLLAFDKSLGVTAKATDVFLQHEHIFCNARVMTDIRPIFHQNPSEKPQAAAIVHTLKIGYHLGREYKEFFVALDTAEIETLREILERDRQKTESLKSLLTDTSMILLEA